MPIHQLTIRRAEPVQAIAAFRAHSAAECFADTLVHVIGVTWGLAAGMRAVAIARLRTRTPARGETSREQHLTRAMLVYALGFGGMLCASAAYNIAWAIVNLQSQPLAGVPGSSALQSLPAVSSNIVTQLRRLDLSCIYLCIAGSYTPLALALKRRGPHTRFLAFVWFLALGGVVLKGITMSQAFALSPTGAGLLERLGFWLYIGLGWAGVVRRKCFAAVLDQKTKRHIASGGLLYMSGIGFHLSPTLQFQNAIWHVFVLAATICIYRGIVLQFFGSSPVVA